jgi:glycosyltransferase involved in cell wall biosynthesis
MQFRPKPGGASRSDRAPALRVGIATSGRFHLLDLARELDALGADVRFYSYVPRRRAEKFGLPRRCHVALLPFLFPLVGLERLFPRLLPRTVERLMCWALDMVVILRMRRCDVFICMSGMYVLAPRFAKWRYGAKIIVERGSAHVLAQRKIIADFPGTSELTPFMVERELRSYAVADQIAIPSTFVAQTFASWLDLAGKMVVNCYGVDLEAFPLHNATEPSMPTVLFVGHWSYRKGSDVLTDAIKLMDEVRLVHVGSIVDVPFPDHQRFVHYEPVDQEKLKDIYASARVFVLPSREDGFGVVLGQALVSGLCVVCTENTGGPTLLHIAGLERLIRVVPPGDANALRDALAQALDSVTGKRKVAPITEAERSLLSWRAYAIRHLGAIYGLLDRKNDGRHEAVGAL